MNTILMQKPQSFVGRLQEDTPVQVIQAKYKGRQVYYYLKVYPGKLWQLQRMILLRKAFKPKDYGEILACGLGEI